MSKEKPTKGTIVVTGGSGKAGRAVMRDLIDHGYTAINVDHAKPAETLGRFISADLTDYGQTVAALSCVDDVMKRVDGVVHLAAIPASGMFTNPHTFETNILSTYNVFEACRQNGIRNLVWASSETVLGLPFNEPPPYVPVDEEYPGRPESAYSLTKLLGEQMAEQFCRWEPTMKIIGLRFSNIMEPHDYARFEGFQADAQSRRWNLWGYIDARDAAQAVRKSLELNRPGADVFIIANTNTVMRRSNDELLNETFPKIARKADVGKNATLLSVDKARKVLGYEPQFDWSAADAKV